MTTEEVVRVRLAAHGLGARRPPGGERAAAAVIGLPDVPRGTARDSLAARVEAPDDGALVVVWSVRGAPRAVAPEDAALFTRALLPPDEATARAQLTGTAVPHLEGAGWRALDAVAAVAQAMRAAVDDGPLGRDALHQALRERLPEELLWPCRGCGTRHVHPVVWRAAGLHGGVRRHDDGSRAAAFAALDATGAADAAELVRRALRANGPSTTAELKDWLGTSTARVKALLEAAGAQRVDRAGTAAWWLPGGAPAPAHRGVRLLPPGDALLEGRDRAALVPDAALRGQLFATLGRTGAVLADGRIAGTWRARTARGRLRVEADARGVDAAALEPEISTLAAARGSVA